MKKLQNGFTTPEQSKRLLELGVPADSADCAMFPYDETFEQYELRAVPFNKVFSTYEIYNEDGTIYPGKTPCWSVGRLIDISRICTTLPEEEYMFPFWYDTQDNVEWAILVIESGVRTGNMDFSKLEE